ncbi:hypothetical protein ACNPMW_15560, partial [Acinetobacter junii]|uniref:hypothetical protein n=1 Tax=Acinetobacter junii TaxID=40215 RepID=UPI003AA9B04B
KHPVDVKPDCTQTSSLFCIGFLILYSSNMYGDEIYLCNKAVEEVVVDSIVPVSRLADNT